jgi:hypothetical protein
VHEDDIRSLSSADSDEEKKENEEEKKEEAQIRPTATTTNQNDATADAPRIGILQRAYNFVSAAISAIVGCFSSARTNNDPSSVSSSWQSKASSNNSNSLFLSKSAKLSSDKKDRPVSTSSDASSFAAMPYSPRGQFETPRATILETITGTKKPTPMQNLHQRESYKQGRDTEALDQVFGFVDPSAASSNKSPSVLSMLASPFKKSDKSKSSAIKSGTVDAFSPDSQSNRFSDLGESARKYESVALQDVGLSLRLPSETHRLEEAKSEDQSKRPSITSQNFSVVESDIPIDFHSTAGSPPPAGTPHQEEKSTTHFSPRSMNSDGSFDASDAIFAAQGKFNEASILEKPTAKPFVKEEHKERS